MKRRGIIAALCAMAAFGSTAHAEITPQIAEEVVTDLFATCDEVAANPSLLLTMEGAIDDGTGTSKTGDVLAAFRPLTASNGEDELLQNFLVVSVTGKQLVSCQLALTGTPPFGLSGDEKKNIYDATLEAARKVFGEGMVTAGGTIAYSAEQAEELEDSKAAFLRPRVDFMAAPKGVSDFNLSLVNKPAATIIQILDSRAAP